MLRAIALLVLGGVLPLLTPAPSADAQERRIYPFCFVRYGPLGASGSYQCGFTSFAQCMATASGIGGQCEQNPELLAQAQQAAQKKRKTNR